MKVGLLVGGPSEEAEASRWTAKFVSPSIARLGHQIVEVDPGDVDFRAVEVDLWFNCLHGGIGENGTIQGALDLSSAKYTGSGVLASAVGMDKVVFKTFAAGLGIKCAPGFTDLPGQRYILKPRRGGGSMGMRILSHEDAVALDSSVHSDFMVEEFINGRSVTVGILETGRGISALPPVSIELIGTQEFYDEDTKYGLNDALLRLDWLGQDDLRNSVQDSSIELFFKLGCRSYSRFDFVVTDRSAYLLEINTLPGLYPGSNFCFAAEAIGISFDDLVRQLIENSMSEPPTRSHVLKW